MYNEVTLRLTAQYTGDILSKYFLSTNGYINPSAWIILLVSYPLMTLVKLNVKHNLCYKSL